MQNRFLNCDEEIHIFSKKDGPLCPLQYFHERVRKMRLLLSCICLPCPTTLIQRIRQRRVKGHWKLLSYLSWAVTIVPFLVMLDHALPQEQKFLTTRQRSFRQEGVHKEIRKVFRTEYNSALALCRCTKKDFPSPQQGIQVQRCFPNIGWKRPCCHVRAGQEWNQQCITMCRCTKRICPVLSRASKSIVVRQVLMVDSSLADCALADMRVLDWLDGVLLLGSHNENDLSSPQQGSKIHSCLPDNNWKCLEWCVCKC